MVPLSWSGGLRRPVHGLVLHQRIGRARHTVGEGDRGLLGLFAAHDLPQPVFPGLTPTPRTDLGNRAQIKQPAQIPVAHLGDTPQPFLAARRVWPWRQTQPGRQVSA